MILHMTLKNRIEDPQQIDGDLRKLLADQNDKLPQVLKAKCLSFLPDCGMTFVNWNENCKTVNEWGNYRLPSYIEKQKNYPRGLKLAFRLKKH